MQNVSACTAYLTVAAVEDKGNSCRSSIMRIYGFRTQAYVGEQFVIRDQFLVIQYMPFLDGYRLTQYLQFVVFSGKKSCSRQDF